MSELGVSSAAASQIGQTTLSPAIAPSPRLVSAAHEFEAAMMKELMAPLEPGHNLLGADGEEDSSSALDSFAGEALGKAISEHGGFGIAKAILRQLTAGSNHSGKSVVPQNLNGTHPTSPF